MTYITNVDSTSKGYKGEKIVSDVIQKLFKERESIGKHGYLMNFQGSKYTIEADILVVDKELGINVFEVKGIHIENILYITANGWECQEIYKDRIDPVYQVDRTSAKLLEFLKEKTYSIQNVGVKSVIVLPYITSTEWKRAGFDEYAFLPPIMFQDDLQEERKFFGKLNKIPYKHKPKKKMAAKEYEDIKRILFGENEKKSNVYKVISEDEFLKQLL